MSNVTDLSLESKSTRFGEAVIAAAITGQPIDYIAGTTYNEHLDVLPVEHFGTGNIPSIKYIGMGIGSDHMQSISHPVSNQVIENPTKYIHSNNDAIPFIPMPYLIRKEGEDDLTTAERAKYAMRAVVVINSIRYIAYFLRAVEVTGDKVSITVVTTDETGNIVSTDPLAPSTEPLNPTRDAEYKGEAVSTNEFIQVRAPLMLSLSPNDVDEILNAAAIMFNVSDIEITEFSMVAGIPHEHVVVDNGANITYTELIGAQSTHFSPLSFSAAQRAGVGIDILFKLGQSLPMS